MIKVKVKTLLGLAVLLIAAGIIGYWSLPSILYDNKKYDALLKLFPNDSRAEMALYFSAGDAFDIQQGDYRIFIYPAGSNYSSGRTNTTADQRDYAIQQMEKLIRSYGASPYIYRTKSSLAKLYMWGMEWDKAEALFKELKEMSNRENEPYLVKETDDFLKILESRHDDPAQQPLLTGKVTIGDKPAKDVYVVLHPKDNNGWHSPPFGHYPVALTDNEGVYRFYDAEGIQGDYEVGVGVTPEQVNGSYLGDPQIRYVSLKKGTTEAYDLTFAPQVKVVSPINKEVIKGDKLDFAWEAYPGASYYELSITDFMRDGKGKIIGSMGTPLEGRWKETNAVYSVEVLRQQPHGYSKSGGEKDDKAAIGNSGILGAVYPGGDFIWSVQAYDSGGKLLSSSSGYNTLLDGVQPFFSLASEGILEGDRFVMKGDYESAIHSYEAEEGSDYALRALASMAMNGVTMEDNGDAAKGLAYLKRIAKPSRYDLEKIRSAEELLDKKQVER
ncbi:tol-pal system YbgF family protein [Paenibacillus sp. NPDC058174]|uniref:tetratricopeptide repeat protein n=1 Tax=Paenibacillus sp. NPDC058174 TaxID=3346366 RepID=UPI0036D769B0